MVVRTWGIVFYIYLTNEMKQRKSQTKTSFFSFVFAHQYLKPTKRGVWQWVWFSFSEFTGMQPTHKVAVFLIRAPEALQLKCYKP